MNVSPEESLSLISARRSVRKYQPDPIPEEALNRCLEAARLAPSANNGQPWHFTAVADERKKGLLAHAARFGALAQNPFAAEAPVIVAVCETPGHRPTSLGGRLLGQNYPLMDIGMAVENFCLQAASEGLGTCILGLFTVREVRKALNIPKSHRPRLLITLGKPYEEKESAKKRHPKDRISRYIKGRGVTDGSGPD